MNHRHTKHLIGQSRRERGAINEEKVKLAFDQGLINRWRPPRWFRRIEVASPEKDAKGIDVIIYTWDIGNIQLQVKSSTSLADKHRKRYPRIPVVVIHTGDSSNQVRAKVFAAIEPFRQTQLSKRRQSSDELVDAAHAERARKKKIKRLRERLDMIIIDPRWPQLPYNVKEVGRLRTELALLGEVLTDNELNLTDSQNL